MIDSIQGWFDFQNIYDRMVAECRPGGTIIELGVWKGKSLCYLTRIAKEADKGLKIIGIDNWKHTDWDGYQAILNIEQQKGENRPPLEQCRSNLAALGLLENVQLIESDTITAAEQFAKQSVDHIFVDDTHNNDHVWMELMAWIPRMRRPTWIAGHDYPGLIESAVRAHFLEPVTNGECWIGNLPCNVSNREINLL